MDVVTDVSSYTKNVLRMDLRVRNKGDGDIDWGNGIFSTF